MTEAADAEAPINPYAAPSADLHVSAPEPAPAHAAPFYAMSPMKLMVMCVLTGGLYDICFWWRQWRTAGSVVAGLLGITLWGAVVIGALFPAEPSAP